MSDDTSLTRQRLLIRTVPPERPPRLPRRCMSATPSHQAPPAATIAGRRTKTGRLDKRHIPRVSYGAAGEEASLLDGNAGQEEEGGERTLETWDAVERQVASYPLALSQSIRTLSRSKVDGFVLRTQLDNLRRVGQPLRGRAGSSRGAFVARHPIITLKTAVE
jgi:hypothetical protein